jgi:hypothetical protein
MEVNPGRGERTCCGRSWAVVPGIADGLPALTEETLELDREAVSSYVFLLPLPLLLVVEEEEEEGWVLLLGGGGEGAIPPI